MSFGRGEVEQTYAHLYVRLLQGITPFVRVKTTGHSLPSHLTSLPIAFQWGNLFCLSVQQFTVPCISMERSAQFVSLCSDSCYAQPQFESQSARKPPNEMMPIFSPIYFLQNFFVSFFKEVFLTGCWTANYITGKTKRVHNKIVWHFNYRHINSKDRCFLPKFGVFLSNEWAAQERFEMGKQVFLQQNL